MEEVNKKTKKIKNQDNKKAKKEKIEKKGGERKSDEKKSAKKVALIVLIVLVILGGGGFALKTVLTKTTVTAETVKMPDDARGFSNYFKEYLLSRVRAERLFSYSFRDLSDDEILNELTELKDGFSKVSRGVNSAYKNSEYRELAGVMESDSAIYLTAVRELRTVMTDGAYGNEGDRQLAFMRKVEETTKELRSALYIAREAFDGDVSGLSSKGVLLFNGVALVEVGGGVKRTAFKCFIIFYMNEYDSFESGKLSKRFEIKEYEVKNIINDMILSGKLKAKWNDNFLIMKNNDRDAILNMKKLVENVQIITRQNLELMQTAMALANND